MLYRPGQRIPCGSSCRGPSHRPVTFSYLYSGGGLWNNTTITPGIGTARPYEYIGAPFVKPLHPQELPQAPGALLRPCSFTPSAGRYAGERCFGFQIMLVPGEDYHSLLHTLHLMRWFTEHYSAFEFELAFWTKLADPVLEAYLRQSISFDVVQEHVKLEEQKAAYEKRVLELEQEKDKLKYEATNHAIEVGPWLRGLSISGPLRS